jgi:hypothetical protein
MCAIFHNKKILSKILSLILWLPIILIASDSPDEAATAAALKKGKKIHFVLNLRP